jgi:hypothetical protein
MKKTTISIILLLATVSLGFAGTMQLGDFATGTFLDSRYNVAWQLQPNGIRLINSDSEKVIWDFRNHDVSGVSITPSTSGVTLSFSISDWDWTYELTKDLTSKDIKAKVTLEDGSSHTFTLKYTDLKFDF